MSDSELKAARRGCLKAGVDHSSRMIMVCMDQKTAKCASAKQMRFIWKHVKRRLKELNLHGRGGVLRVKTGCIGICRGGPIVAVMPDGVWYGNCTPDVIDRILQEHLIEGRVVKEHRIAQSWPEGCEIGSF